MIIRVLGPVEAFTGDELLHLAARERCVLATLAADAGRLVPVNRIIDTTWPGGPPPSVRNRIHSIISRLRQRLGHHIIITRAAGYVLELDGSGLLDAAEFERIVAEGRALAASRDWANAAERFGVALRLWRGQVYEDVVALQLTADVARLTELRRHSFEQYAEIRLKLGEHADLIAELTRALAQDPLHDRLRAQLMVALYRCGRQAEAIEAFETGARVLADEYGLDPCDELRQTRQAILLRDPTLDPPRASVPPVRPHYLPPDLPDFVGRRSELKRLGELLRPPPPHLCQVVSISGMGGVGKTALAVRAARAAQHFYPDGCLHTDLGGLDPVPADPATVLQSFTRVLGHRDDGASGDVRAVTADFRSLTHGQRMLLMFDNAHSEEQVRPLLPAGGCTVLIASRRALTGIEAASHLPLDVLPFPDSIDLLRAVAGADRIAADRRSAGRVAHLCSRLPLALRIAAIRLATHAGMSVAALAERLCDPGNRLDELRTGDLSVRCRLTMGLRGLDPASIDLLGLLSREPGCCHSPSQAARLCGRSVREARASLEALAAVALLSTADCERYHLPELVRLCALDPRPRERQHRAFGPDHLREKKLHRRFTQVPSSLRSDPFGDPPVPGTQKGG